MDLLEADFWLVTSLVYCVMQIDVYCGLRRARVNFRWMSAARAVQMNGFKR
jgi:hypothetical protein